MCFFLLDDYFPATQSTTHFLFFTTSLLSCKKNIHCSKTNNIDSFNLTSPMIYYMPCLMGHHTHARTPTRAHAHTYTLSVCFFFLDTPTHTHTFVRPRHSKRLPRIHWLDKGKSKSSLANLNSPEHTVLTTPN